MFIFRMFSRKWILTTLLVVAAIGAMIRLGIWQLDRHTARQAFNARVQAQLDAPPLNLDAEALNENLGSMEYRQVTVTGRYEHSQEIALRNQAHEGQWGVHLITPLVIEGTDRAILVDRGWIPGEEYEAGNWSRFAEEGLVEITGVIRASRTRPDFGRRVDPTPVPGGPRLETWNFVNVEAIGQQVNIPLLPAYVQQAPEAGWSGYPARTQPHLELTEGSHLGYAMQWFLFATILGAGYPFFIRRQEEGTGKKGLASKGVIVPLPGEEKHDPYHSR